MTIFPAKLAVSRLAARPHLVRCALLAIISFSVFSVQDSVVRASCGDWLAMPGHSLAPGALADGPLGDHVAASIEQAFLLPVRLADRYPGPAPCNGPKCRKGPDTPAPPVPASVLERGDKLGISAFVAADVSLNEQFGLSADWDARPAKGFHPRIEHPPRA